MRKDNKYKVVIVDDIAETRENIQGLLSFYSDIEVIGTARNGTEGIQVTLETKPHVVLMDINMPDMDGIAATERIRGTLPATQVVILSVQGDSNYMRRAMLAGAIDYLVKPPGIDDLLTTISHAGDIAMNMLGEKGEIKEEYNLGLESIWLNISDNLQKLELYKKDTITASAVDLISQIASGYAHDLRSPLSIIMNIVRLIDAKEIPEIETQVNRIIRRVNYSNLLVDRFLGIGFNERTVIKQINIKTLIIEIINSLEYKIPSISKIKLSLPENMLVYGDYRKTWVVLSNLIENITEVTGDSGNLLIRKGINPNSLEYVIEDSSVEYDDEKIFDFGYFARSSNIGIELFVAHRFMILQLGNIEFIKTNQGQSTFRLIFPNEELSIIQNTDFDEAKKNLTFLEEKIIAQKKRVGNIFENRQAYELFKLIVSRFANNLYNELAVIMVTAKESLQKLYHTTHREINTNSNLENELNKILRNCEYVQLIIRNLIHISSELSIKKSYCNIYNLIDNVLILLQRKMPPDLYEVIWVNQDPTITIVFVDEGQMMQVFMNIFKNSLDSMPNGGKIILSTKRHENKINISIQDTGIGIPRENLKKIATLGFSTKERGFGIGLYSSKNIITHHGGDMNFKSTLGQGTTVIVKIPIEDKSEKSVP